MTRLRIALCRILAIFRKKRLDDELDAEIRSHLDMQTADNLRTGMTEEEARLAALRSFGGVELARDLYREARTIVALEQVSKDLLYSVRSLLKTPGFTIFAALTLAIGVGANTTVFNAYNAIGLKPIAVADPNHVVRLKRWFHSHSLGDLQHFFSYTEYKFCLDHSSNVFSDVVAASRPITVKSVLPSTGVRLSTAAERLTGQLVSANFFSSLGIVPAVGRGFAATEDRIPGGNPVIIVSDAFWNRALRGDPKMLGEVIQLNGMPFTIVGVAPPEFKGTGLFSWAPDFWAPLSMQQQLAPGRNWLDDPLEQEFQILARLRFSASRGQAEAQTDELIKQFDSTLTERDPTTRVALQRVVLLGDTDDPRFQAAAVGFMLLVGLILLVACANIANMILARCATRQREIGVRIALGSGRNRVIRQLLMESFLVATLGGVLGLVLAIWSSHLLNAGLQQLLFAQGLNAIQIDLGIDRTVFAYALVIAVITGIIFGLSPALQFSRPDLTAAFKEEGTPLGIAVGRSQLRGRLVAVQVAVSMFLLVTAGLLYRGLTRSHAVQPGFDSHDIFMVAGDFGYRQDPAAAVSLQRRLVDALRGLPELNGVALGSAPWLGTWTPPIVTAGETSGAQVRQRTLGSYASESYLDLLGISFVRGRTFTPQEVASGAHVAIISESTVHQLWGGSDGLGKHFQLDMDWHGHMADFEVIGVVKDVRFANLTRIDPSHVYLPASPGSIRGGQPASYDILLRSRDGLRVLPAVQSTAAFFDKDLASDLGLPGIEMGASRQVFLSNVFATLAGILASLALILAGTGIYGVLSYLVSQRTREIGIRMSLGATSLNVLRDVILEGLRPVFIGMILGLTGAAVLSWALHSTLVFPGSMDFLYGVPFYDPLTFGGLFCFVLALAATASLVPAHRALRVDPMVALRHE